MAKLRAKGVPLMDKIFCKDFIDQVYVPDRPLFLQNMLKLLKTGGKLAFTMKMASPYIAHKNPNTTAPVAGYIGWARKQAVKPKDYNLDTAREDKSKMRLVGPPEEQAFVAQIMAMVKDLPANLLSYDDVIDLGADTSISDRLRADAQKNVETIPADFAAKKMVLDEFTGPPYSSADLLVIADFERFSKWNTGKQGKGQKSLQKANANDANDGIWYMDFFTKTVILQKK